MKRREFCAGTGLAIASSLLPASDMSVLAATSTGASRYELVAQKGAQHLAGPANPQTELLLYGNSSPGPLLVGRKSEMLEVDFINRLDVPSTIHWHGIRNLNEMDGVPELTQPNVEPGEQFHYRFVLKDAGTFWYHAHNMAWEQVARGLYGPLIVLEEDEQLDAANMVLVFDDWRLTANYQIDMDSMGSLHDWSHGGRLGNWLTINGISKPDIHIAKELPVRLRLINAANARIMTFSMAGNNRFEILAIDGAPCAPVSAEQITLAPAQRLDVMITLEQAQALQETSSDRPFEVAMIIPDITLDSPAPNRPAPQPWYPRPDTADAQIIDIHMQGGAMGNLSSAIFNGEELSLRELAQEHGKLWAFNGEVGGYHNLLGEVELMKTVLLRVHNDTGWPHAIHLHGQHFWVQAAGLASGPVWVLRDTHLMAPREKAEMIFVADNPGQWLFHCHMLEHHAAGMGGVISVG
jgi:FtsP/CotA-like multicopper oxidase with cupredoxin domain